MKICDSHRRIVLLSKGAEVQVHYVGTLVSDGSKFDSSRDRAGNFKFKIGKGNVIKGWDVGVATMLKGEKAELYCRSDYAYGAEGSPPKIPGGATLKFEVELLSWADGADAPDDDDEDDEYDESYLQKFDSEITKSYLNDFHPECLIHNYDEIAKLTRIVKI